MDFIEESLLQYVEQHTQDESPILKKLNRETHAKILQPRMLSGHLQGRVLAMITHMIQPKNILEIGTYTGYSAICMAEALSAEGTLTTIDINEELEELVSRYFKEAGIESKIDFKIGNALTIIPELKEAFDLVFIDADKENYSNYFDLVIDKVRSGGFIVVDNVLWSGKVLENKPANIDKDTQAIKEFNSKVHAEKRVENVLFPIRDGLMILRKK